MDCADVMAGNEAGDARSVAIGISAIRKRERRFIGRPGSGMRRAHIMIVDALAEAGALSYR